MTPEMRQRLALAFPGLSIQITGVVGVAGVVDVSHYARKPLEIRPIRPLRREIDERGKAAEAAKEGVSASLAEPLDAEADAIEERAALAADCVPACYLDAWARIQCQRPLSVHPDAWRRAINDAGLFLDSWGADAAAMHWSAGELFDVPRAGRPGGLVWQLNGERVKALGEDRARLTDGRTIKRGA